MWFRPGHKSSGSTTFPGRLLCLFLPKTNLLGLSTIFLKVHSLQQQQQKKAAFKETICLSGSVQKDLGSRQICRDWMWTEQLTERKRETLLSKGSKQEVGPRTAGQLLLLLNFFVHSTNILVWIFSVPDSKDTAGSNLEMVPPFIVLPFSQMYLLDSQVCTVRNFLTVCKTLYNLLTIGKLPYWQLGEHILILIWL